MKYFILLAIFATLLCSSGCSRNNKMDWLTEDAQQAEMVLYLPYFTPHHLNEGVFVTNKVETYSFEREKKSSENFLAFTQKDSHNERDYRSAADIIRTGIPANFTNRWKAKLSEDGKTLEISGYTYGIWYTVQFYELSGMQISPNTWGGTGVWSFGVGKEMLEKNKRLIKFNWQLEPKTDKPKEFDEKFRTIILTRELPKTTGHEEDE